MQQKEKKKKEKKEDLRIIRMGCTFKWINCSMTCAELYEKTRSSVLNTRFPCAFSSSALPIMPDFQCCKEGKVHSLPQCLRDRAMLVVSQRRRWSRTERRGWVLQDLCDTRIRLSPRLSVCEGGRRADSVLLPVWGWWLELLLPASGCCPYLSLCLDVGVGAGIAQLVVSWARCPAWCSIAGSILLWASSRGDFPLGVKMGSATIFPKLFRTEYKPRSSLCTHAVHRTESKDPDIHVLDEWIPVAKTHSVCTIHEDGLWLPQWLD